VTAEAPLEAARQSGLIRASEPLLVLVSGGADSICLLDVAVRLEAAVSALHVNYGLREGADADEEHCRALCERLGVPLTVERAPLGAAEGPGNVQAEARERRYAVADELAKAAGGDYATAHTASDQAETVLYRLAVSPGRRALAGMRARRGRLVRPLLRVTAEDTREYCTARGLDWREDPSNADLRFARARIRHEVLPRLRELNPTAERTIAETSALLQDEQEVLEGAVDEALERLGGPALPLSELRALPPALARLVLRRIAGTAAEGEAPALSRDDVDAILRLGDRGGSKTLDLGAGLRAVVEYGTLRFTRAREEAQPEPVEMAVPGRARFGAWTVEARAAAPAEQGIDEALLDAAELGTAVIVRGWREGDRMRPAGLGGSKSLQDLFTDRKIPRALRHSLPLVEADGEVAWVAGVATGERFRAREDSDAVIGLSARHHSTS
jgi:tRNA(Ile)-lysidine synthase